MSAPPYPPLQSKVAGREESTRFGSGGEDSRPCHASPALQFPRLYVYHSWPTASVQLCGVRFLSIPPGPAPLGRARMRRAGAPFTTLQSRRLAAGAEPSEGTPGERRCRGSRRRAGGPRRHVTRPQPRRGRLSLRRRTRGAARAARPGLWAVPAHRLGATAVPQREPRGQRPRRLQAVGGAERPLQGGQPGRPRSRGASQG